MAVDFNGQTSALNYAYYTLGNTRTGSSLVTMGGTLTVLSRVFMAAYPSSALGSFVAGCVNVPPGFGGYNKMGLLITPSGFVRAWAGGNPGVQTADSAAPIPLNQWAAIEAAIAAASLKAYVDGTAGTENTTAWSGGTLEETIIGAYPTTNSVTFARPYTHCLQGVAFFNRAITADERAAYVAGTSPDTFSPEPLLYVPFASAATAADATHNGSPISLYFKTYNSNPADTTATVDDCASSPEEPPDPEPEPEPEPTPGMGTVTGTTRLLKPYEKPPIAVFKVR